MRTAAARCAVWRTGTQNWSFCAQLPSCGSPQGGRKYSAGSLARPQRSGAITEGGDKCGTLVTACQCRYFIGAATAVVAAGGACFQQDLRTWVVLVDGAEHQLDLIRAEAARRAVTIHVVIDLIHVLEYIWKAAWSLHDAGDPAAEDWVAAKALAVLAGDSARAVAEITAEADAAGLNGSRRNGADACVRYLKPGTSTCATTRPSQPAGPSRPASSREHAGTSSPTASTSEGPDGAWTAPKPSSPCARSSATATSRSTGASTSPASTSGSIPAPNRDNTHSAPDWLPHSRGAAPIRIPALPPTAPLAGARLAGEPQRRGGRGQG